MLQTGVARCHFHFVKVVYWEKKSWMWDPWFKGFHKNMTHSKSYPEALSCPFAVDERSIPPHNIHPASCVVVPWCGRLSLPSMLPTTIIPWPETFKVFLKSALCCPFQVPLSSWMWSHSSTCLQHQRPHFSDLIHSSSMEVYLSSLWDQCKPFFYFLSAD